MDVTEGSKSTRAGSDPISTRTTIIIGIIITCGSTIALAAGPQMMEPRVPADKLAEARALRNPLSPSPAIIKQGKALYEGKGTCVNCHGTTGRGDGPGGKTLTPAPRNLHHRGFWRHRTEGELFWVVKHGSPGTAMIPFGGLLSDEEIWTVLQYERSFGSTHRRGRGMEPREGMGPRGSGGMRGMGQHQEGECCGR